MGGMVLVPSPVMTPNIPASCNAGVQSTLTQFVQLQTMLRECLTKQNWINDQQVAACDAVIPNY